MKHRCGARQQCREGLACIQSEAITSQQQPPRTLCMLHSQTASNRLAPGSRGARRGPSRKWGLRLGALKNHVTLYLSSEALWAGAEPHELNGTRPLS